MLKKMIKKGEGKPSWFLHLQIGFSFGELLSFDYSFCFDSLVQSTMLFNTLEMKLKFLLYGPTFFSPLATLYLTYPTLTCKSFMCMMLLSICEMPNPDYNLFPFTFPLSAYPFQVMPIDFLDTC